MLKFSPSPIPFRFSPFLFSFPNLNIEPRDARSYSDDFCLDQSDDQGCHTRSYYKSLQDSQDHQVYHDFKSQLPRSEAEMSYLDQKQRCHIEIRSRDVISRSEAEKSYRDQKQRSHIEIRSRDVISRSEAEMSYLDQKQRCHT